MKKLAGSNKDVLADLLRERLAAARIAVALYDRILDAEVARALPERDEVAEVLSGLRAQEDEHLSFIEDHLRALGEAALAMPRMHLHGFEELARTPGARAPELVPALWALECAQDGAWDLLARLARGAEDQEAIAALERRAREEHAHAVLLRDIVQTAMRERLARTQPRRVARVALPDQGERWQAAPRACGSSPQLDVP